MPDKTFLSDLQKKNLPVTNNLFSKISIPFLPNISTTKFENAKFCTVDIKTQLKKILKRNATKILLSWDDNRSWTTKWDLLKPKEIQLVLNVDGAPVLSLPNCLCGPFEFKFLTFIQNSGAPFLNFHC